MREIKFRGKTIRTGEWVYGSYVNKGGKHQIVTNDSVLPYQVHPETVGQYTGLKDKNGTEIYRGDKILDTLTQAEYVVEFGYCKKYGFTGWYCENEERQCNINNDSGSDRNSQIIITSNIHS